MSSSPICSYLSTTWASLLERDYEVEVYQCGRVFLGRTPSERHQQGDEGEQSMRERMPEGRLGALCRHSFYAA